MSEIPSLSHRQHQLLARNHRKAAAAVSLTYVTGKSPGFSRHKTAKGFYYMQGSKRVSDKTQLDRIKKLAIPPSWTSVWISASASGHIQATGIDLNGRKQYRYHSRWNDLRNETKFHRLLEFGKTLPLLRRRTAKDISSKTLTADKVVATAIRLMEETSIRVGNNGYEKLYGSYGLTTLKDKHVTIHADKVVFSFKGKKGIAQQLTLRNKPLARIIKQCRDVPGKELFQYFDAAGARKSIDSGMVNNYIKDATGGDFSAKDFRTWTGTLHAMQCFRTAGEAINATEVRKNIIAVLDAVSSKLGNSRNICKKYYVHPLLMKLYEDNRLMTYINKVSNTQRPVRQGLSANEKILMHILKYHR